LGSTSQSTVIMKILFLDIETLPAEEGNKKVLMELYKRKKKRGNTTMGTFEEFLESTGLDGSFGRICCISYGLNDESIKTIYGDEKEILVNFWEVAKNVNLFVGFNVMDFDLRFIYQRSIIFGVKPTQDLSFARYRNNPIYDVMHEWSKWSNLGRTSLHGLSKALGVASPKEGDIEGKDVAKAYADGRLKEICEYCERDVEATRKIYKKMMFS
jgi:predicted PolB exonuclease-like 3'-5' exonuclease